MFCRRRKIIIRTAALPPDEASSGAPEQILRVEADGFIVQTGSGVILVKQAEFADSDRPIVLNAGEMLGLS